MIDRQSLKQLLNYSYDDNELISLARYNFKFLRLNLKRDVNDDELLSNLFKLAERDREEYLNDLFGFLDMDFDDESVMSLTRDTKEIINNIKVKLYFLIVLDRLLDVFAKNTSAGYKGKDSTPVLSLTDAATATISSVEFVLCANNKKYLVIIKQPYSSSKNTTNISELKDMTVYVSIYEYSNQASSNIEIYCSLGDLKQRIEHEIKYGRFN